MPVMLGAGHGTGCSERKGANFWLFEWIAECLIDLLCSIGFAFVEYLTLQFQIEVSYTLHWSDTYYSCALSLLHTFTTTQILLCLWQKRNWVTFLCLVNSWFEVKLKYLSYLTSIKSEGKKFASLIHCTILFPVSLVRPCSTALRHAKNPTLAWPLIVMVTRSGVQWWRNTVP